MTETQSRVRLLVDALRSGEFQQTQGNLSRNGRYCCLGVACEVYRRKTGDGIWRSSGNGVVREFVVGADIRSGYLPNDVSDWYGFGNTNPILHDKDGNPTTATILNDNVGASLAEIGDAFEREFITHDANTK